MYRDLKEKLINAEQITSKDVLEAFKQAVREGSRDVFIDERLIEKIDKLEIESLAAIDSGGYGVVFNVSGVDFPIVIKIIDMQGRIAKKENEVDFHSQLKFFKNEVNFMQQCTCENTMPLYGYLKVVGMDADDYNIGVFAILMPRLIPLKEWLRLNSKSIDESDIKRITIDICKALECCRSNGILHKDVKLGNMFYSPKTNTFVLGDFGVSSNFDDAETLHIDQKYCSHAPDEYNRRKYTHCTDVYWLGFTIKVAIPGFLKNLGNNIQLSHEFNELLSKMTEFFPERRIQSSREVLMNLDNNIEIAEEKHFKTIFDISKLHRMNINTIIQNCMNAVRNKEPGVSYENLKPALDIIEKGAEDKGNDSCIRIKAYLLSCIYQFGGKDEKYLTEALDILDNLVTYCEDPIAIFLNTFIRYCARQINSEEFLKIAKPIADSGYSFAAYYCGKLLASGESTQVKQDLNQGIKYIISAIEHGFDSAIVYLDELIKIHPDLCNDPVVAKYAYTEFIEFENHFPLSIMRAL